MAALLRNKPIYTLQEISADIKDVLDRAFERSFWVKAEINKLNHYTYSGHCYPELVDKTQGKIVAQMRSVIWKTDFERVNANFIRTVKEPLKDGIKVLMLCTVTYDAVYGLSLRIHDIDPSYSLGDLELEKKLSLERLNSEGLLDKNKSVPIPLLPKRIAIISVETSKGFVDFTQVIDGNEWGYRFFYLLFPAVLQGDSAIKDIQHQLKQIRKVRQHFDVVAIIRGGGGDVGLSCYNDYSLAKAVAEFPLPVLSGIGHATNETVVEMVTCKNAITPTKLAEFLIQQFHNYTVPVQEAEKVVKLYAQALFKNSKLAMERESRLLKNLVLSNISQDKIELNQSAHRLGSQTKAQLLESRISLSKHLQGFSLQTQALIKSHKQQIHQYAPVLKRSAGEILHELKHEIELNSGNRLSDSVGRQMLQEQGQIRQNEQLVKMADPVNILRRGFSITRVNGTSVNSIDRINPGDKIETEYYDGISTSTVTDKREKKDNE